MKKLLSLSAVFQLFTAMAAHAEEHMAKPWQLGFDEPASPVMEQLVNGHTYLLWLITFICVFVLCALIYICIKFNRRANPVPSKTTHNTMLEIIWTTIPIIILVAIAIPSLRLHYFMQKTNEAEMTIKITGYQWYWGYKYPDFGDYEFESRILEDKDLKAGDHRMLAVDNHLVVPVDTNVKVLLTGADVIHAWALPAFGVKRDAIPGRLNETWFRATKTGTFYGQCSELCGIKHGFMPIVVDVVSKDEFNTWIKSKQPANVEADKKADAAKTEMKK